MATERVTVTLPEEIVRDIRRVERNRSKFILVAAKNELRRRRREVLKQSLRSPHPETEESAELGFDDWVSALPDDEASDLVELTEGSEVCWTPDEGWSEVEP